jgi:hypothetical protein
LISSGVIVEGVVVNFKDLKEVNKDFIGNLSSIDNIRMSLGIKCLFKGSVRSDSAVLGVVLSKSLLNSLSSIRV